MNRDIRFRAWDGSKMDYFDLYWNFCDYADKDWPVMQYTGLKDKNGKEIYEGDAVKLKDRNCVVYWQDCGFALKSARENVWEWNGNLKGYCNGLWGGPPEVIGNIYENSDLLK